MPNPALQKRLARRQSVLQIDSFADRGILPIDDLSSLSGSSNKLTLPITIDWTPMAGKSYDLTNPEARNTCYRLILSEGSQQEIDTYVNKDLLIESWPTLAPTLPITIRNNWETKFPKLAESCITYD